MDEEYRSYFNDKGDMLIQRVQEYREKARLYCHCLGMKWGWTEQDRHYFSEKMRKCRQEERERKQRRQALIPRRSEEREIVSELGCEDLSFLNTILSGLPLQGCVEPDALSIFLRKGGYDREQYRRHVLRSVDEGAVNFYKIAPIIEDRRADTIFRFMTILSLNHHGTIDIYQSNSDTIMLARKETGDMTGC